MIADIDKHKIRRERLKDPTVPLLISDILQQMETKILKQISFNKFHLSISVGDEVTRSLISK